MGYQEVKMKKGLLVKKAVKKTYEEEVSSDKKAFVRKDIENDVFDLEDSVADNAKMISMLISFVMHIYEALGDDVKDNLSDEFKAYVEYAYSKFKTVNTRGSLELSKEGVKSIDRLLERQNKIAEIVEKHYK